MIVRPLEEIQREEMIARVATEAVGRYKRRLENEVKTIRRLRQAVRSHLAEVKRIEKILKKFEETRDANFLTDDFYVKRVLEQKPIQTPRWEIEQE